MKNRALPEASRIWQRFLRALRLSCRIIHAGLVFSASLITTPSSALQVKLQRGLNIATLDATAQTETSVIAAGSVVDIPDTYRVVDSHGKTNAELTLNNWLQNAGRTEVRKANHGGGLLEQSGAELDYYYPIQIVSLARGSHLYQHNGKIYFLALRFLKRSQNHLVTTANVRVQVVKPRAHTPSLQIEGASNCPDGRCDERSSAPAFDRLVHDLGPVLRRAEAFATANRRRTEKDFETMSHEFQRSCGFSLNSFLPVVKDYCDASQVPTQLMLSIMLQESSAHCYAAANNDNQTRDSGLFGVNSKTAKGYPRCSAAEISSMRRSTVASIEKTPECVENPVFNLRLAIAILKEKLHSLTDESISHPSGAASFDRRQLLDARGRPTMTAWRLAVSSYNGGEKWVFRAKADLEAFNRVNGTQMSATNWQDLRVFYLRRFLTDSKEKQYFGEAIDGRTDSAIANLSYTENIIPAEPSDSSSFKAVADLWKASGDRL